MTESCPLDLATCKSEQSSRAKHGMEQVIKWVRVKPVETIP